MLQARECGISAFAYNANPAGIDQYIKEFGVMADIAGKVGFKVIPFPAVGLGETNETTDRGLLILEAFIKRFVDHPAVLRMNGKMLILIDSADYTPFSRWENTSSPD